MTHKSSAELLKAARERIGCMHPSDVDLARRRGTVVIVDVRDANERATRFIPGSVHASRGMLEFHLDPENDLHIQALAMDAKYVFVCGSGGRASLAAATAREFGLADVSYMEGGMRAWLEQHLPVENG